MQSSKGKGVLPMGNRRSEPGDRDSPEDITRLRIPFRAFLFLALDILLLAACIYHIPSLLARARAPFEISQSDGRMVVSGIIDPGASGDLRTDDVAISWNHQSLDVPRLTEFFADFGVIGEKVALDFTRGSVVLSTTITLVPFYNDGYIILVLLIGMSCWLLGMYVLIRRPKELTASVFHWGMVCMAMVVILSWEGVTPGRPLFYLSSVLFFGSYLGAVATFFFFTTIFPRKTDGGVLLRAGWVYLPGIAVIIPMVLFHSRAVFFRSPQAYVTYLAWFDVFHAVVFLYIAAAIIRFIRSYLRAESSEERKKIQWVLYGFCLGPTPFLLLTVVPSIFFPDWSVDEAYTLPFLIILPVAFAISLIRYHVLDIELVINRTTVYAMVLAVLIAFYVVVVGFVAGIIGAAAPPSYAIGAVLVGLLFEPARRRVQHFVDRTFFRVRYDFREAERMFVEEIKNSVDLQELANLLIRRTDAIIPVERIGLFVLRQPGNRLQTLAHKNFGLFERRTVPFEAENLRTSLKLPVALADRMETGIPFETGDERVFRRWGIALVFVMLSRKSEFLGFLVLGGKKSGARFTAEDVDLLTTVTAQAGMAIERMKLMEQLVLEQAEAARLAELNRMKSDFVSYVSHEFKTPLTSIKLFAELLKARQRRLDAKGREFIETIEGEADRLDRMVTTVLDSAKIEHGVKQFSFEDTDLGLLAEKALTVMNYQLTKNRFNVVFRKPRRAVPLKADPDAVLQAIINLMANAVKYSGDRKYMKVTVTKGTEWITCSVEDRGVGIAPESQKQIFDPFYREAGSGRKIEGVGLGLPLVKRIMDAHNGRVEVRSQAGKGSTFVLMFPPLPETRGRKRPAEPQQEVSDA
jgi:signal transduction histidine kinase